MEHLFIINPAAGKRNRSEELKEKIKSVKTKDKVSIFVTEKPGQATEYLRKYLKSADDFVRVYACGGDGTANEVLTGAMGFENCAIGIIPMGSGNDFVRSFKKYKKDDFFDIERMMYGEDMKVDVMECQGRYSMNVLSVGYDSAVAKNVDKFKKIPLVSGSLAYKLSIVYCLFTKRKHNFRIVVDGKEFVGNDVSTLLAVAGNGSYYGGGIMAAPKAKLNDGKIEFMHITTISALRFILLVGKYTKGLHVDNPKYPFVKSFKCNKLEFLSDKEIDVNFEGEIVPVKNPVITIISGGVRVITPEVTKKELTTA